MAYYLNNVYDHLVKRYKDKVYKHIDPNSQDMARTLKIYDTLMWILHRYEQFLNTTNLDAFEVKEAVNRFKLLQEPTFTKVFDCLKAITYKNPEMQKVLWKYRDFFVLEKRAMAKQYGELDLLNSILDNKELLSKSNDWERLSSKVLERMSKENFPVVIKIFAKISTSNMNKTIRLLAKDLLTNGPINQAIGKIDESSLEVFESFVIILTNFMKENKTLVFRNSIIKKFTFAFLFEKIKAASREIVNTIDNRFNNKAKVKEDEGKQPINKFIQEGFEFEFKYLDDVFQLNNQEYIELFHTYIDALFELYILLYFTIFKEMLSNKEQLESLQKDLLVPLCDHIIAEGDLTHINSLKLLSRDLAKLLIHISPYLNMLLASNDSTADNLKELASM